MKPRIVLTLISGDSVAFTPKGGCPLKLGDKRCEDALKRLFIAFTPKGGCPLKLLDDAEAFSAKVGG